MPDDRAQHASEVAAMVHRLIDIASEQPTHRVALEALISAYVLVAVCHPCCAKSAAATARKVADLIENTVASFPPGANHIH